MSALIFHASRPLRRIIGLIGLPCAQLALAQQVPIAVPTLPRTSDFTLRVVDAAGGNLKTLTSSVSSQSFFLDGIVIRDGDDIKSLLRTRNIRPDAQALAYTAQLNPAISHLDQLQVGDHLLMPFVKRESPALKTAHPAARIAITTVPKERSEIGRSVASLTAKLVAPTAMGIAPDLAESLRNSADALARPELIASAPPSAVRNLADRVAATVALVAAVKAGQNTDADMKAVEVSAASLNTSISTLSGCRASGASCMAQLIVQPLEVTTRKPVVDVKLYYTPVLWRAMKACAPPNGHPCRHDFYTNSPAYEVGLSQDGSFAVWATRGEQVVSCDLQIDPPITSGKRTLEVYATAAERDAAGCAPTILGSLGPTHSRRVASAHTPH
jgi:hypothetical protein